MADTTQLEKTYDPQQVESEIYALWEQSGAFRSTPHDPKKRNYCIVIPPPNVTGALHLGHALNNTLQDILIRYHRMRGFNTLWQPGTDHAGIATQAVVERRIREQEGKTRHEIGRDALVERIWKWKDAYEARIISQLKLMGCSCDWERIRFTLDDGLSKAVRHIFFRLFKDGLIFRGKRLVNWDTQLQTAVSDDEVYHETVKGHFWHFKYPVIPLPSRDRKGANDIPLPDPDHEGADDPEYVLIATTRPETMLGDTAVAVHPDPEAFFKKAEAELQDSLDRLSNRSGSEAAEIESKLQALRARRESHLAQLLQLRDMANAGRMIKLPLVCRPIPLIADEWADPTKGSGCVKITPAHDPNDYEVGLRHNLPMINVLTPDGKVARIIEPDGSVNENNDKYEGLTFATEGRAKVVADLDERGLLGDIEDRDIEMGFSDRSKLPIEPFLSRQWFVNTDDISRPSDQETEPCLAQRAMDAVNDERIRVFPPRYAKSYLDWLGEKRDWCISRQLWWGHRIPVWRHPNPDALVHLDDLDDARTRLESFEKEDKAVHVPFPTKFQPMKVQIAPLLKPFYGVWCPRPEYESEFAEFVEPLGFKQDPDVLDTWFSSALWPFSTLGWPDKTEHLKQYYPGSVLCTSRDIITNWVARMVMFGLYGIGKIPFDHVYIHPKILDGRGETMSKSKGNGVDPVDVIHTHGADALRYSMADMCTETQDIRMPVEYVCPHCGHLVDQAHAIKKEEQARKSRGEKLMHRLQPADCKRVTCDNKDCGKEFATQWADDDIKKALGLGRETSDKFDIGRNFCNKLWNAARFAFLNLEGTPCNRLDVATLLPEDRWILATLSQTIRRVHECWQSYQFSAAVKELRDFFWDALCDWYIELTKPRLAEPQTSAGAPASANNSAGDTAKQILAFCMDQTLRLWHPVLPFITERLWQQLGEIVPQRGLPGVADLQTDTALIRADFPPEQGYPAFDHDQTLNIFGDIQDVVRAVRELRSQCQVSPKDAVKLTVALPQDECDAFKQNAHIVARMANVSELTVDPTASRPPNAGSVTIGSLRVFVHDISDDDAERKRTTKALDALAKQITGKEKKLSNEQFVANAKPEVVEAERQRLAELTEQRTGLEAHLAELGAWPGT